MFGDMAAKTPGIFQIGELVRKFAKPLAGIARKLRSSFLKRHWGVFLWVGRFFANVSGERPSL